MAINWAPPGVKSVGEYQCSGVPWVTSSNLVHEETRQIQFPNVTKTIIVKNASTGTNVDMSVGFTELGVQGADIRNHNYINLGEGESLAIDLRIKDLFLSSALNSVASGETQIIPFEILAGLTDIPRGQMGVLTGSVGYEGVG